MIVVENRQNPLVSMEIHFRSGSAEDPPGKEGLTYLTSHMLLRGTASHGRQQFVEALELRGSSADIAVGREVVTLEYDALTRNLDEIQNLCGDALSRPALAQEELDRLRRQTIAENDERRDHDESLARHVFYQALLSPDRRARPIQGTRESLARITREDVLARYREVFGRRNMIVGAAGDIDEASLRAGLDRTITLPDGEERSTTPCATLDPGHVRVLLVDKPDRAQTQIFAGHRGIRAADERFVPLLVANTIYGGTFTARLSHEIREKRGWSYGAYSFLFCGRTSGSFAFRYYPKAEDAAKALQLGLKMQRELVTGGVTEDEVDFAKRYLIGRFPFRLETSRQRMNELLRLRLLDLDRSHLDELTARVAETTRADVNRAISELLKFDDLTVVMVCTADTVRDAVAALPEVDEVVVHPYEQEWPHPDWACPKS